MTASLPPTPPSASPAAPPAIDDGALAAWIAALPEDAADALRRLDGAEDWPTGRDLRSVAALTDFAAALAAAPADGLAALRTPAARNDLMRLLAALPASRCVVFADWLIDAVGPGAATLFHDSGLEDDPAGAVVRRRLLHVNRRRLLDEIFDAGRIARVRDAVRDARNEIA